MRVAVVTNIPTHYREPLYERVAALLQKEGHEAHFVFGARRDAGQRWPVERSHRTYQATFLRESIPRVAGRALLVDPRVVLALERIQPTVVVAGAFAPWIYFVAAWARARRVPTLIWSAETPQTAESHRMRRHLRSPLVRTAAGFLAYGPAAAAYLRQLGVAPNAVTVLGNGIDVTEFLGRVDGVRGERDVIRRELGVDGDVVLAVGGKGLDVAVPAVARVGATLVVAGPVAREERVISVGMVAPSGMARLYVAADVLVHTPVADYWPHAINEALSAGIPVVASPATGVPAEVLSGPGCAIVPRDVGAIEKALREALRGRHIASSAVREAIRTPLLPWAVGPMADRFVAAVGSVAR